MHKAHFLLCYLVNTWTNLISIVKLIGLKFQKIVRLMKRKFVVRIFEIYTTCSSRNIQKMHFLLYYLLIKHLNQCNIYFGHDRPKILEISFPYEERFCCLKKTHFNYFCLANVQLKGLKFTRPVTLQNTFSVMMFSKHLN